MELQKIKRKINSIKERYNTAVSKELSTIAESKAEEEQLGYITKAQDIVQIVSQALQQQAHEKLASVVTACLQEVFYDEDYGLDIRFEKKRNKTEAKLVLLNGEHEIEDPLNEDSGGVVDVAAFVLRLSCLMLSKPPVRKIMVMDEPFKFVSEEYLPNVKNMIEKLAEDFGVQFILVTHLRSLLIGKIVNFI